MSQKRSYFRDLTCIRRRHRKLVPMPIRITARDPVLLDLERSSLALLPHHVLVRILSFIQDSDSSDIWVIAAVSSILYETVRYIQYHTLSINLDKSGVARNHLDLLSRNLLCPAVRTLKILGSKQKIEGQDEVEDDEILTQLANMLPGMTGLRDIHWHVKWNSDSTIPNRPKEATVTIPLSILHRLSSQVRLHTSVTCEDDPRIMNQGEARGFLSRLADNTNLYSLSVEIAFWDELECRKTMRSLKYVLLSVPISGYPEENIVS